jgi:hypothetical protein
MALTKESVIDQITVLEDGQIQVRRADKLKEDGVEIAKAYHRHVVVPGGRGSTHNFGCQCISSESC